jgi:hypothetical protein
LTQTADNPCRFFLDFDLNIPPPNIPCPTINATGAATIDNAITEPELTVLVTAEPTGPCSFNLDFELNLPQFCPTISASGTVNTYSHLSSPELAFFVEKDPESCEFNFIFDLGMPPSCVPVITATSAFFCTPGRTHPTAAFKIHGPTGCKYLAELNLEVPCPRACPAITGAVTIYKSETPTGAVVITHETPRQLTETCEYIFDFQLGLPNSGAGSKLELGELKASYTTCDARPTLWGSIEDVPGTAIQRLNLHVVYPVPAAPYRYVGGTIDLGALGTGTITVEDAPAAGVDECGVPAKKISASIELYTTGCA